MPPMNPPDGRADLPPPHEPTEPRDDDPLRQLFHRHANHFAVGPRARQIRLRLRDKLFASDPDAIR